MKYKDNNFLKFQDRQRDGDAGYLRTWNSNKSWTLLTISFTITWCK